MSNGAELELRRLVADGLRALNERQGGRYMSAVARTIDVDRTTVTRWANQTSTASVDHCRALSVHYPEFFTEDELTGLHARAALGGQDSPMDLLTVGATVYEDGSEVHRAAAEALRADPGAAENRVCKLTAVHLDRRGIDPADLDPEMDEETSGRIHQFREAMMECAKSGWKIQNVVVTANPARLDSLEMMAHGLEGPDVEIRAYPMSVPLVLSPLIVANREVFLAYDHRRFERPHAALHLRSRQVVRWANGYFDQLFLDAPFVLRTTQGPDPEAFAAFRRALSSEVDPTT